MSDAGSGAGRLSWGLHVATLNRIDDLRHCVTCALRQTRMPAEIVIVDASADWEENRRRIGEIVTATAVPLRYLPARKPSAAAQRNQAIVAARADVLFLIDDDAKMHADCAERIMDLYESDPEGRIAAVQIGESPDIPAVVSGEEVRSQREARRQMEQGARSSWFKALVWRELLLMSVGRNFIAYDGPLWEARLPDCRTFAAVAEPAVFLGGFALTVRRRVAEREPFDDGLLAYSIAEDREASYRYLRHGCNLKGLEGLIYHAESPVSRLKRYELTVIGILNVAYLTMKNTRRPLRDGAAVMILWLRRLLAELIKDTGSRRFGYPQFRAALYCGLWLPVLLTRRRAALQPWYEGLQSRLIWGRPRPPRVPGAGS